MRYRIDGDTLLLSLLPTQALQNPLNPLCSLKTPLARLWPCALLVQESWFPLSWEEWDPCLKIVTGKSGISKILVFPPSYSPTPKKYY